VEYSLATVGVAGLLTAAVLGLGEQLAAVFDCMSRQLDGSATACGAPLSPGDAPGDTSGDPPGDEGTGRSGTGEQPETTSIETTTTLGTPTGTPTPTPSPSASGSTTTSPPPDSTG
jgi:hypothetical protein